MFSIYDRAVGGVKNLEQLQEYDASNDRAFTATDTMTVARPILAGEVSRRLLTGTGKVTKLVIGMAATDMEGKPGRWLDKHFPDAHIGCSAHGVEWDFYADTSALLIVGGSALAAPRVTKGAKLAIGTTLTQEGTKAAWAVARNQQYMKDVRAYQVALEMGYDIDDPLGNDIISSKIDGLPSRLKIPVSGKAKAAMADKLTGLVLGVATHDHINPAVRSQLTVAAGYFSGNGSWNGEMARREYNPVVDGMIDVVRENTHQLVEQYA